MSYEYDRERRSTSRGKHFSKRSSRRLRNRIIIISTTVVALVLIIVLLVNVFGCMSSGCAEKTSPKSSTQKVDKTKETTPATEELSFITPNIKDDGQSMGEYQGSLYVWNKKVFELFFGDEDSATRYASLMNDTKKKLGDGITLYTMILPNHVEMGLPARLKNTDGGATTLSQADYVKAAYTALGKDVKYVNAYNGLAEHCNEYIYFDSDHHWTGLGAYYAYVEYTKAANLEALELADCNEKQIDGFIGTLTEESSIPVNTDSVHYWELPYSVSNVLTDDSGESHTMDSVYYPYSEAGTLTYGVFLCGDYPSEVITSESDKASGKIAIVHESYGNAIVPYFTYNYKEVHSIDFRSWSGSLAEYCEENGIDTVLFVNGVMSSAAEEQIDAMTGIQ